MVVPGNPSARAKIFDFSLIKINNASSNLGISGGSEIPIILQTIPAGFVDFQKYPVVGLTVHKEQVEIVPRVPHATGSAIFIRPSR